MNQMEAYASAHARMADYSISLDLQQRPGFAMFSSSCHGTVFADEAAVAAHSEQAFSGL